ncbi:hypothetical protein ACIF83_18230 [Streptomyces sp. NPDC085866]|uniref:hypothetical protein n=1 Tax=Streptomyces sp. NPDC085866 TaxID=3365736 RepID=UPI0037D21AF2
MPAKASPRARRTGSPVKPGFYKNCASQTATDGKHHSVAYPERANEPMGFVDFISTAHFTKNICPRLGFRIGMMGNPGS